MEINDNKKYLKDNEIILKKEIPEMALLSEKSLAKAWLSKEDEEVWKDL